MHSAKVLQVVHAFVAYKAGHLSRTLITSFAPSCLMCVFACFV